MALRKKKIEFYKLSVTDFNGGYSNLLFENIVSLKEVATKEERIKGKDLELKLYENNSDYLVGIIETSRRNNIPPKKNKTKKSLSKIGLQRDEGLAYGNVFLYDKKREILMYEVNKSGCYLDHFITFIYRTTKETKLFKKFKIRLSVVLSKDEYNRIMNMSFHKSVEVQIAHPDKMLADFNHKQGALYDVCKSGQDFDSKRVFAKFEVDANPNSKSLSTTTVNQLLSQVTKMLSSKSGENVEKIIVSGYENDVKKLKKIDLIADRYIKNIELDEPRENNDLLEKQRTDEIKKLHTDCITDLDDIFGDK